MDFTFNFTLFLCSVIAGLLQFKLRFDQVRVRVRVTGLLSFQGWLACGRVVHALWRELLLVALLLVALSSGTGCGFNTDLTTACRSLIQHLAFWIKRHFSFLQCVCGSGLRGWDLIHGDGTHLALDKATWLLITFQSWRQNRRLTSEWTITCLVLALWCSFFELNWLSGIVTSALADFSYCVLQPSLMSLTCSMCTSICQDRWLIQ